MTTENTSKQSTDSTTGRDGVDVRCLVRHLDLFSGIGGFALAAERVGGIETVGFCEIDPWARKVLAKNFPGVPMHDDIKTLNPNNYGRIDLITGGYPCQPFSYSGVRKGEEDDRHLWPQVFRIINKTMPRMVLCENVVGHVTLGLDLVLSDLESIGYAAETVIIPACAVGAPHRRDRVWILAYANGGADRQQLDDGCSAKELRRKHRADIFEQGCCRGTEKNEISRAWHAEPYVGRVAHGLPSRLDRIRGLGNAIVPQVAEEILRVMTRLDSMSNDPAMAPKGHKND